MYNPEAQKIRRCTATRRDGQPCGGWALWDSPTQRCRSHSPPGAGGGKPACRCAAYNWPHAPGHGLCRWPLPPLERCPTPAHSHRWPRLKRRSRSDGKTHRL